MLQHAFESDLSPNTPAVPGEGERCGNLDFFMLYVARNK